MKDKKHIEQGSAWQKLTGSPEHFTAQNRTINALGIITFFMLAMLVLINLLVGLSMSLYISGILLVIQGFIYYLSRIKKRYNLAIIAYAIGSYAALCVNYYFNSGISGPTLFLFFLTFQLLLAITPQRQHGVWAAGHLLLGIALILSEYIDPDLVMVSYADVPDKYIDFTGTYIISLGFIYLITNYLLSKYNREKKLAEDHAKEIEEQNEKLKEIAWLQSHKVRNHVSTIMGLSQLFNDKDYSDPTNKEVINGIMKASAEMDETIKRINMMATDVQKGERKGI